MGCCLFCCCRGKTSQFRPKKLDPLLSADIENPPYKPPPSRPERPAPPIPDPQEEDTYNTPAYATFGTVDALLSDTKELVLYDNKYIWLNPYTTEEFLTYLDQQLRGKNVGLVNEFNELGPLKFRFASDSAMSNRKKNFDANFIPYDMSRVVMKDESSYLNASIIPGFYREGKYIVAQIPIVAPQVSTLGNFWQMVWQENVRCMVSLTSDLGQGDPEKGAYWPKDKNKEQTFADTVCVKLTQKSVYELATHRTFIVSLEENRKKSFLLQQIEINSKLIEQKPPAIIPVLLSLVQQITDMVGNTGNNAKLCFVSKWSNSLIGILLVVFEISKALEDKSPFSVFGTINFLLDHRISLVTEYHHYKLIYLLILELIQNLNPISLEELKKIEVGEINPESDETNAVMLEYQKVGFFCNKAYFKKSKTVAEFHSNEQITNSFPYDENRVNLINTPTNSDYINASYIHMESGSAPIIAAVHPTRGNVREFFWMLMSSEAEIVLVLGKTQEIDLMNDGITKTISYWSPITQEMSYGEFNVLRSKPQEEKGMEMFEVLLSYNAPKMEKREHKFKLFLYKGWDENDLPTDNKGCLEVLQFIEGFRQGPEGHKPVVIQSIDGSTKIGVMLATMNGCSQIRTREELDLPWIVKNLRSQRMHLINSRVRHTL